MTMEWKIVVPLLAVAFTVASADFIGGPVDTNMNDQGTRDALQFAVVEHNKNSNDIFVRQVAKVVNAQKQLVSGMKYIFTVQMARTPCRKGGVEKVCPVHKDKQMAAPYKCTFEVWSRPWLSDIQMVKNQCKQ
ncbi:cystatin [Salmo trutta]|uniref:Cystatin n=1 Tax=Salmo trutta TaxID=8032 RepID=A0A674BD52_SALTR|nr:cystatin [Salmo trutta]